MIDQDKSLIQKLVPKALPHILAIVAFLIISATYFSPIFQGKVLSQHDTEQFNGMAKELRDYYYNEGETSEWTGSMFSGMPSYQISVYGGTTNFLHYLETPFKLMGSQTMGPVFMSMLMAYLMFIVLGFRPAMAAMGAVAYSLGSYNIIIIAAGHVTKAWVIAYMPLVLAGILGLFRKNMPLLLCGLLVALGLGLQIKNNHLQITFYTGLLCLFIYIYYAVVKLMTKDVKTLLKASGIMVIAVVLGICCNLDNLYGNYEMGQTSIRGKSDLKTALTPPPSEQDAATGIDKDKEYAFAWSYGKSESLTFLVPNMYGGASKGYDESSHSFQSLINNGVKADNAREIRQSIPQYWGDQPSTSGPVYFGIIIFVLFVLGMIIIKDNLKWVLFGATLFFLFLSWGSNFTVFNDWFYYNFPLYNKFRAVSMALVIPAITMLIIALWGLKEFLYSDTDKRKLMQALYISAGSVALICLVLWIAPTTFTNFASPADGAWKSQLPEWYYNAVLLDRKELLTADAGRSLLFVVLAGALLWGSLKISKDKPKTLTYITLGIALLTLIDLWGVDKRYLSDDKYLDKTEAGSDVFKKTAADEYILKDANLSYRVLKVGNPFNDASVSYHHKSIGGYHAAKLKRYQELIEFRLGSEVAFVQSKAGEAFNNSREYLLKAQEQGVAIDPMQLPMMVQDSMQQLMQGLTVMNTLNAKYIIYHPELPPIVNPYALGNAWFVDEYKFVETADQEITSFESINPSRTAILNAKDRTGLDGLKIVADSTAGITLTEYKPNRLTYRSKAASEQLAVFSEIFYANNGWQAYIDGVAAPHYCTDWTLRSMRIPAGEHEIIFKFEPHSYWTACRATTAGSAMLILALIGFVVMCVVQNKKGNAVKETK